MKWFIANWTRESKHSQTILIFLWWVECSRVAHTVLYQNHSILYQTKEVRCRIELRWPHSAVEIHYYPVILRGEHLCAWYMHAWEIIGQPFQRRVGESLLQHRWKCKGPFIAGGQNLYQQSTQYEIRVIIIKI